MKTFQDSEEELRNVIVNFTKNVDLDIPDSSVEKIIIETYNGDSQQNEDSNESEVPKNISKNTIENTEHSSNLKSEPQVEVLSKKYSCDECGDVFLLKSGFSHHMMQKHDISIPIVNYEHYSSDVKIKIPKDCKDNAFKFVQKSVSYKTFRFQCQICKEGFQTGPDLKSHYDIHRTYKCDQCGAAFIKKSYLKDHMLMHTSERKYICDICEKTFKYRNGLSVHKSVHVKLRSHICEVCGQGFNARTTLLTHTKLKHYPTNEKYTCADCGITFKVKSWLDKHIQRRHTKNRAKDFICSICGIAYLNKYTLTRHMNDKHLGNGKRHYCHICNKSYTMKNKLFAHMQNKHNIV